MNRSFLALLCAALLAAAGCAGVDAVRPGTPSSGAGAPIDLHSKSEVVKQGSRHHRALPAAEFNLAMEADEEGPPRAWQILRANAQREGLVREAPAAATSTEKAAGLQPSQWTAIGPGNIGGRVRALAIDPRNASRIFAGTASGGIWLTENAGTTWRPIFDFLPNLSVTTVVFDPSNPDTMYLGTGEASQGLVGLGAFKSTDGGLSWRMLPATNTDVNADWRFVNRLAIHPTQPQVLLAGVTNTSRTSGGIYRTADGGESWSRVATMKALDVAFDPNNPANAVAGLDDGRIAYSRDAGLTWTRTDALVASPSGGGNTARAEVAFARSQPGLVYAVIDNEKGEFWRSNNSGAAWTKVSTPAHMDAQGFYNNALWVDPTDPSHVIIGGIVLNQSFDGGQNFIAVSLRGGQPASPHVDHHAIVSVPNYGPGNRVVYDGNDGGVYRAANILAVSSAPSANGWTNLNNGLAVTQFYSGTGRTAAGGRIVGGTQDNGSLQLSQGQWRAWFGGDGGMVAVDPASDQWVFGEYVHLALHRSSNGGLSSAFICNGITEAHPDEDGRTYCGPNATKKANFIAPFALDPNNANRLLAGGASLWATDNAKAATPLWRAIKPPTAAVDNFINAITVAEGSSNVAWVGHNNGEVYRSLDANSAAPTWTRMGQGTLPARAVQRIMVDRDNPARVIVATTGFVANNVWQSLDAGATWASIHSNLPFAPVFDVKRHPSNPQWLYAATSVGLFTSENGGATWSTTNQGPANIRVREIFWKDNATLVAATFGRGMFQASVASGPANYQDLWWGGSRENGWGMSLTQHGATLFLALYIYDAQGRPVWAVMPGGAWNAGFTAYTGALYVPTGSWYGSYNAAQFSANAPVGSATVTFTGADSASLAYTVNGVSATKPIERQSFGVVDSTPVATFGDLWWGGASQDGWGLVINQQYRTLFCVWYTYDTAGRTTWYVIPGGTWTTASTFTGTVFRTTGSAWVGAAYDPGALTVTAAGTLTLEFGDANHVTMSYSVDGITQSKILTRQPF
jgi:hypothetical protein